MNEKVPTCPACREPITQKKRSRCLACGKELHRWCALDRWCLDCVLDEPHTRAKALALARYFEIELCDHHPAAIVFAASLMVGGKRDAVRELLDNWPPGIEAVMDNFEKYGIWTPEGEIVIDDVGEDADELTVSIAYSLAMMCGAGELVRIPVEEQANEPQEIPGA